MICNECRTKDKVVNLSPYWRASAFSFDKHTDDNFLCEKCIDFFTVCDKCGDGLEGCWPAYVVKGYNGDPICPECETIMIGKEKRIIPDFPRTRHLPYKPNASRGDTVASEKEVAIIFECDDVFVEEKIDGSNSGMCLYEGYPIIRNRNHILNKAFTQRRTSAKMQFASIFNWFYENIDKFSRANDLLGFPASIYGEWMYASHGVHYDSLPSLWIPYDIYNWQESNFVSIEKTRSVLSASGFTLTPLLHVGKVKSYEQLEAFCQSKSEFSSCEKREGIYIKAGKNIDCRFKMVREGFGQDSLWKDDHIIRNKIKK